MLPFLAFFIFLFLISAITTLEKYQRVKQDIFLKIDLNSEENIQPEFIYALEIKDLNQYAIDICNLGLSIITQCVEQFMTTNDENSLSDFCKSVVNEIRNGHDLTTDVQYLWSFLPNQEGTLQQVFNGEKVNNPNYWWQLGDYLRYYISQTLPQKINFYFYNLDLTQFHYIKPSNQSSATPCAYIGIITR